MPGTRLIAGSSRIRIIINEGARVFAQGTRAQPVILAGQSTFIPEVAAVPHTLSPVMDSELSDSSVLEHVYWYDGGPVFTFGTLGVYRCKTRCIVPITGT